MERTRKAGIVFQFLWGAIVTVTLMEIADCLLLPQNLSRWLAVVLVVDVSACGCLMLNRRGQTQLASCLLLGIFFVLTVLLAWTAGGIYAPIIQLLPFFPLLAGLLFSWRAGATIGVFCALFELGLVSALKAGFLPASVVHHTAFSLWATSCFIIAMLLQLQYIAVNGINQALKAAHAELAQRQQAEGALRNSELFRKRIFENSRVPIVVMDAATHCYIDCNPAAVQIYGFSFREECLGKTPLDVSAAVQYDGVPSLEKIPFYVNKALAENTAVFEWRHQRPNGEIWDAEVCLMNLQSDGQQLLQFTLQDITEHRRALAAVREQAALLDASHDSVIVWDLHQGITYQNPAAELLTGRTITESKSKPLSFVLRTRSELVLTAALQEVTKLGKWTGELVLLNGEGKPRDVASRWIALNDTHGNVASILITCNDITEQKQLHAQYLHSQRLESVGTLASGVAHDLNNILSPILMGADMLEMTVEDAESRDTVAMMKESARRGSDTVKQLLTFARAGDTQKGPIQPRHLLKEITRLIQQTFPKNIQIYSDFTGHPSTVLADPSQLHQVLMNLCVNARDAMPEGGVLFLRLETISLDFTKAKMHPNARPIAYVVFTISDSGAGIPPEVIERIFDPFFTTKPQGKGTGLGLSTVLGIVENHDGFVQLESRIGQGTTFQVFIPANATTSDTPSASEPAAAPRGRGECVLVVDDEPAIRSMTESVLRKGGYQTLSASNASEAVHLYERNHDRIKAVLTDVMMPFGDGRSLIMMLYEQDPKLPIIAMSGLASTEFQHDLKRRGACRFLSKPFTAEQLLANLAQALQVATSTSMLHFQFPPAEQARPLSE